MYVIQILMTMLTCIRVWYKKAAVAFSVALAISDYYSLALI